MARRSRPNPIQIQKFLKGMDYPAKKRDLIQHAQKNKADKEVISLLEGMKEDSFNSPAEVSKAIGEEE
jgi:hypothetical protein